jgi:hypothetical protein
VKLMPPKYVKAYVKRGKTDAGHAGDLRQFRVLEVRATRRPNDQILDEQIWRLNASMAESNNRPRAAARHADARITVAPARLRVGPGASPRLASSGSAMAR